MNDIQKIILQFEYQCYPLWLYNEKGELLQNELIAELRRRSELEKTLLDLQAEYDNCFINDGIIFGYQGFQSEDAKVDFLRCTERIFAELQNNLRGKYELENRVNGELL